MRYLFVLVLGLLATSAYAAGLECTFTTECVEGDCAETSYELSLAFEGPAIGYIHDSGLTFHEKDNSANRLFGGTATDISGTSDLTADLRDGAYRVQAHQPTMMRTIVVDTEGAARMSVLMTEGPLALTYFGNCKEAG